MRLPLTAVCCALLTVAGFDSAMAQTSTTSPRSSVAGAWIVSLNKTPHSTSYVTLRIHLTGTDAALSGAWIGTENQTASGFITGDFAGGVLRVALSSTGHATDPVTYLLEAMVSPNGTSASGTAYLAHSYAVWPATLTKAAP
jgi:hypothetical protein